MKNLIVAGLVGLVIGSGVLRADAPALASSVPASRDTVRQQEWLAASIEARVRLAERIGEDGARLYAEKMGYEPLLTKLDKGLPQGFDQVYRAKDGSTIVIEAKGGTSAVMRAYGCQQGTPEWAVQAAKRVTNSSKATVLEKQVAKLVLEAARDGELTVYVIRTPHILGKPGVAVVESTLKAGKAEAKAASAILEEMAIAAKAAQGTGHALNSGAGHLPQHSKVPIPAKPSVVRGADNVGKDLTKIAGVEEQQVAKALQEASKRIRKPDQSVWAKVGGKTFKFVGQVAAPAGIVITVAVYSTAVAEIEQRFEHGELTRQEADVERGKLVALTAATTGGAMVGAELGAVIGTFICPVGGTIVGGLVGAVGGCFGAELMMAATGLTDTLGEYLEPGIESVRKACEFVKSNGIALTIAARDQIRRRVGPQIYDEAVACLNNSATWVGDKGGNALRGAEVLKGDALRGAEVLKGDAVRGAEVLKGDAVRGAEVLKGDAVRGTVVVSTRVSDGARRTWTNAMSGWGYLRSQLR